jgi:two-component SAPR family response regulator
MKYIIADPDEQNGIDLKKILDSYEIFVFQGSFTTLEIAENSIHGEPPDIAFIMMGKVELNAFKLASEIRELNPFSKVIFISSQVEYAVEAFECEADGFLLVPFNGEKIMNLLLNSIKRQKFKENETLYRKRRCSYGKL